MFVITYLNEKQAVEAEQASIKYMRVKFLTKFIGKEFDGMISTN